MIIKHGLTAYNGLWGPYLYDFDVKEFTLRPDTALVVIGPRLNIDINLKNKTEIFGLKYESFNLDSTTTCSDCVDRSLEQINIYVYHRM